MAKHPLHIAFTNWKDEHEEYKPTKGKGFGAAMDSLAGIQKELDAAIAKVRAACTKMTDALDDAVTAVEEHQTALENTTFASRNERIAANRELAAIAGEVKALQRAWQQDTPQL